MELAQPDWQRRRSDFNHQWLKNRLLSTLDTVNNVIGGRVRGVGYVQEVMAVDIAEWPSRRTELNALLDDFETDMSPRVLFDYPPLSECEPRTKMVLADLMHVLWLNRYSVQALLEKARKAADEVDSRFQPLHATEPFDPLGRVRPEFAVLFEQFRSACRVLSKAIERLPSRILVT